MSNGLDALDARADRAKRKPPPPQGGRRVLAPQHPAPAPLVAPDQAQAPVREPDVPKGQQTFPGLPEAPGELAAPSPDQSTASSEPPALPDSAASKPLTKDELRKIAVYLEGEQDTALEALRYLGTAQRPRLDVSKSAVVRFALKRLLADLSHEEIVGAIAASPVDSQATGRKRR